MKDIEIEIQVNIEKSEPLINFLKENGSFQKEVRQIDEYFSPVDHNFFEVRPVKEWLRLRNSSNAYSINYKNYHYDKNGKSSYCDEREVVIKSADQMKEILNFLGFKNIVTVDKVRKIWVYKDYEISIDLVKNLGNFVEIEYIGNDKKVEPHKITNEMIDFLKNIDCGAIKRNYVGYPFQLMFPEEIKFEEQ